MRAISRSRSQLPVDLASGMGKAVLWDPIRGPLAGGPVRQQNWEQKGTSGLYGILQVTVVEGIINGVLDFRLARWNRRGREWDKVQ